MPRKQNSSRRTVKKTGSKSKSSRKKSSKPSKSRMSAFAQALKASKTGGQDVEGTKDKSQGRRGGL